MVFGQKSIVELLFYTMRLLRSIMIHRGANENAESKKVLRAVIGLDAIYLLFQFIGYLFMDEPLWETPYDEVFVGQENLILEVKRGDFISLLYTVGEYVEKWTGSQRLMTVVVHSYKDDVILKKCLFYYDVGYIDEYWGRCTVLCIYDEENQYWEISSADKKYYPDEFYKSNVVAYEDTIRTYIKGIEFLGKNDYFNHTKAHFTLGGDVGRIEISFTENVELEEIRHLHFYLEDYGNRITGEEIRYDEYANRIIAMYDDFDINK